MHKQSDYGLVYTPKAPYEVLSTLWMDYGDILLLKSVEEMVEVYYNSQQFQSSVNYLEHFYSNPFSLFEDLAAFYEAEGLFEVSHSRLGRYDILRKFVESKRIGELSVFGELLIYDLYLRENLKSRPYWSADPKVDRGLYMDFYNNRENIKRYLPDYESYDHKQVRRMTHIEHFTVDIEETTTQGRAVYKDNYVLFDYMQRDPLTYESKTMKLTSLDLVREK